MSEFPVDQVRSVSRNPILWAAWLAALTRARRLFPSRRSVAAWTFAALLCATLIWIASGALSAAAALLIRGLLEHSVMLMALVAIYAFLAIARQRHALVEARRYSWLAAAPIRKSRRKAAYRVLVAIAVTVRGGGIAAVLFLLACIARDLSTLAQLLPPAAAGFFIGAAVGRLAPARRSGPAASRYTPKALATERGPHARLSEISRWPVAQTFAWHRPENARLVVLFALFTVQGGSSLALGLSVVGAWLLAIYLAALLGATVRVARAAASWLRATPLGFTSFLWALSHRTLLHQVIGTAIGIIAVVLLGLPIGLALYLAMLWLTLVLFVVVVGLAEIWRTSDAHALKLSMSVGILGMIEAREHGWAIPLAFALAYWRVRRASALEVRSA